MAVLLGFVDDVTDLKWRHKLIVPTIASFPLLVAYNGVTSVVVPKMLRSIFGHMFNLGIVYHIYMGMLAVFCTNSINIYAGINGIEAGQSFIIACFIFLHNVIVSHVKASNFEIGNLPRYFTSDRLTAYILFDNYHSLYCSDPWFD